MSYRRMIRPVVTHLLVAAVSFTAAYYAFAFLAIGAAINKCGTDTFHTLAENRDGGKVIMIDSVCGLIPPWHDESLYRVGADGERDWILNLTTNRLQLVRVTWTRGRAPVLEVPRAHFFGTYPDMKRDAIVKFGRVL